MVKQIMIVVPAEGVRELLRIMFEKRGYRAVCYERAEEATRAFPHEPGSAPDLIFVDAFLLESWLEWLIALVRDNPLYARTLVVALVDYPGQVAQPQRNYVEVEQPFHVRKVWQLAADWEAQGAGQGQADTGGEAQAALQPGEVLAYAR